MTKNEAIRNINRQIGVARLNSANTHWSNIVEYGSSEGWWLNIPFHKFSQDLHLILNCAALHRYIHITVPANSVVAPRSHFRNKNDSADIFIPSTGRDRLVDLQSGSSRHDFGKYPTIDYSYG